MPKKKTEELHEDLLGSLVQMGSPPTISRPGVVSSGIPALDALFVDVHGEAHGGFQRGNHWVFAGKPKVGKSLFRTHMIAAAQKQGLNVGLVASERDVAAAGPERMQQLGVRTDELYYIGGRNDGGVPYVMEDTLGAIARLARAEVVDVVFIDSLNYLTPRAVASSIEKGDSANDPDDLLSGTAMAAVAQTLGKWAPGVFGSCTDHGVSLFFITHYHENPGAGIYQDSRYITGGYTFQHSASGIFWVNRRPNSDLRKAEKDVQEDHHFFKLVLKESRLAPAAGMEIKVALPLTCPLWESPLYKESNDASSSDL